MITYDAALQIVQNNYKNVYSETVPLVSSLGRVLCEDIVADMQMPPFRKSAMDGYACRRVDLNLELKVIETISAGAIPQKTIGVAQCAKIMTGAMVPEGADCVFMVEHSEVKPDGSVVFTKDDTKSNICEQGEDIEFGDILIKSGAVVTAAHIATMAAMGYAQIKVAVKPKVGILVTGSELVEPSVRPKVGQIRDSNGSQLYAQVIEAGGSPQLYSIVVDEREVTRSAIQKAVDENDLVLISGGSSMGDWDFVPELLQECGLTIQFYKVAIKPGKPTAFAIGDNVACFAMPGNPVSTFVVFDTFVKPWILGSMGANDRKVWVPMTLKSSVKCKRSKRQTFVPVSIDDQGYAYPVPFHGSAHINALIGADGLITFPLGTTLLEEGTVVNVRLL